MPQKKKTNATKSDNGEIAGLEEQLAQLQREKAQAVQAKDAAKAARLQENEMRVRTRLLELKAEGFAASLSQPVPLHDKSKALLEVLEERLELIENRLTAIEDRLEKL